MTRLALPRLLPLLSVLLISLSVAPARAQTYPEHQTDTVNDFAGILDDEAEARITAELTSLRTDIGVEMTVVTIHALADYDATSIESFATGLFNSWGVGDATRNDGIMILVSETDREMRLELGAGYPSTYDWLAEDVVDLTMLPRFRDGDLQGGIEAGVKDAISRIAEPFAEGRPPAEKPATPAPVAATGGGAGESSGGGWAGIGIGAVVLALIAALFARGPIGRMMLSRKPCPKCGQTGGLKRHSETLSRATTSITGTARTVTDCSNCGWHDEQTRTLPRVSKSSSSSSGGSFGGGSSSGGGATGKW